MAPQVRTASGTLALQKQCARKGFRASCISQHTGPVAAGPQGSAGLPQPFMKRHDQVAGFILAGGVSSRMGRDKALLEIGGVPLLVRTARDRKSTRLNSSHVAISYAVFCLKKKLHIKLNPSSRTKLRF